MRAISTFLFLLFLCSFLNPTQAQIRSFDPNNPISNISIKQWTAEDGLASNNITSVFQDSKGLIWITSYNGFMIYDGERFEIYDKNNLSFLDTDGFIRTFENLNGDIYLASQGSGIIIYKNGNFEKLKYTGDPISQSIRTLFFTSDNALMVGTTNDGLYKIKEGVSSKVDSHPLLKEATVMAIQEDLNGTLWVATEGVGLFNINQDEIKWVTSVNDELSAIITSLILDKNNNLLIGSENGLQILSKDGELNTIEKLEGIYINNLMVDDWNSVWLGTEKGIVRWNEKYDQLDWLYEKKGIDMVRISTIMKDNQDNIWVSSNRIGLIHFKESLVTNMAVPSLSSDRVYIIHESWDGRYYIGTDQNKIDIYDGEKFQSLRIKTDLKGNGIRDIYHDEDGSLWFASYVGIIHLKNNVETLYCSATGMPANNFRTILKDRNDFFWFGTRSGGLVKFKEGKIIRQFSNGKGLESNFVVAVSEAPNGDVYVGTHSGGMTIIDSLEQCKTYYLKDSKNGILFFNIDIKKDKTALITANIGPVYFDGDSLIRINLESDLRSKTYFDMIDDNKGHIWVTTNIGVLKIKSKHWDMYLKKELEEVPYIMIDDNQGMNNKECTGATRSILASNGNIMIPTLGGICVVSPTEITQNSQVPITTIRRVTVDNRELSLFDQKPIIAAGAVRFTFHFSVLSYSASERNQYRYMLEGFDKEWSPASYEGQVEYTNLPPGEYTFKVKGANDIGIWAKNGDTVAFIVESFFYETIWFYLLIVLTIGLILFGMYKWRISIINRKNVELKKVNAELDRFVYSASHELRSPLSSILGLINVAKMDNNSDKSEYFEYIEKSVNRLDLFIHDIIDHSRNSRQELQINEIDVEQMVRNVLSDITYMDNFKKIHYEINNELDSPLFNDSSRLKIVLSNLITNAFKHHAPDTVENPHVHIHLKKESESLRIHISDNGLGIEKKHQKNIFKMFYRATTKTEGTGLGLYIVAEIIGTMKGKINMKSNPTGGTKFTITLPSFNP